MIPMDTVLSADARQSGRGNAVLGLTGAEEFAGAVSREMRNFFISMSLILLSSISLAMLKTGRPRCRIAGRHFLGSWLNKPRATFRSPVLTLQKADWYCSKEKWTFSHCIRFLLGDASRLDQLSSNSFDVVVCNMALMFIKRFEETIQEVAAS